MAAPVQVHLVDGTYELFRAHFGAPSALDRQGREVGATRGFLRSLFRLLKDVEVTHVAVAFDHVVESFRNELFAGYKTGDGLDPALLGQFPRVEAAARALGVVVWPMVEFEADDGLATAAARFRADDRVRRVVICSPDKDLCQCVVGDRVVTLDRQRKILRGEDGVVEKFGVLPASIPDYLALVGDDADGIPGLQGWGAKSTAKVLAAYPRLEDIPDDPALWTVQVRGAGRLAARLAEAREAVTLYRTLATLREDVPLPETLEELAWHGPDLAALEALCEDLGDTRFPEEVRRWQRSG